MVVNTRKFQDILLDKKKHNDMHKIIKIVKL